LVTSALLLTSSGIASALPPLFVIFATTVSRAILAPPRNHHDPAIRRQRFGAGLADAAAAAGHPGHAFPAICHANCLRCFVKGVFANERLMIVGRSDAAVRPLQ